MSRFVILSIVFVFGGRAHAQAAFDTASIKRAAVSIAREGGNRARIQHTPTSLSVYNVTLSDCVQWAYGVAPFQVSGSAGSESYDILAKTEAPVTVSELRTRLQNLLAERFKLTFHRESRQFPVYELVAAKGGAKLPAVKAGERPVRAAESLPRVENDSFVFVDVSLAEFGRMLSQLRGIELPVIDRTGIPGSFDIVLTSAPAAAREGDRGGLFALIQEQLGLRLAAAKAPFEVLVIDHWEKPEGN